MHIAFMQAARYHDHQAAEDPAECVCSSPLPVNLKVQFGRDKGQAIIPACACLEDPEHHV